MKYTKTIDDGLDLRYELRIRGASIREFSLHAGVHYTFLSKYLVGKCIVSEEVYMRIKKALKTLKPMYELESMTELSTVDTNTKNE